MSWGVFVNKSTQMWRRLLMFKGLNMNNNILTSLRIHNTGISAAIRVIL